MARGVCLQNCYKLVDIFISWWFNADYCLVYIERSNNKSSDGKSRKIITNRIEGILFSRHCKEPEQSCIMNTFSGDVALLSHKTTRLFFIFNSNCPLSPLMCPITNTPVIFLL